MKNLLKFYEPEFKLKSDSTFREDMVTWINTNDENLSQSKKEECEEILQAFFKDLRKEKKLTQIKWLEQKWNIFCKFRMYKTRFS